MGVVVVVSTITRTTSTPTMHEGGRHCPYHYAAPPWDEGRERRKSLSPRTSQRGGNGNIGVPPYPRGEWPRGGRRNPPDSLASRRNSPRRKTPGIRDSCCFAGYRRVIRNVCSRTPSASDSVGRTPPGAVAPAPSVVRNGKSSARCRSSGTSPPRRNPTHR